MPDGLLSGELIFQIEKNQVTNISFPFTMRFNGCTIMSSVYGTADKSTIQGDQLHALMLLNDGGQLNFDGTFSSAQEASGTL